MELSRQALLDRISGKVTSIEDFNFDNLVAPPLSALLTPYDIDCLYSIATSVKYSGNPAKKYQAIDRIMRSRGFVKLSAGTNRVVYRHLEDNSFVVKVAADAIGIKDNPREFQNQFIFKPFVTKVFEVSPCGTVGVFEKVNPIESREEFLSVADDIYDVINEWFIGKYIMADIGTKFFMNWGIRTYNVGKEGSVSFGPVLLDFPYVYELDGNKLFCSAVDKNNLETGICGGVIDYDNGFNFLHCTKCGTRYRVRELAKKIKNNEIRIDRRRESHKMKIGRYDENGNIVVDDEVVTKAAEKKVNLKSNTDGKPSGTLTINMSGYSQAKPEKKEKKTSKNNSLRTSTNSRGMVTAPVASDIKVDLPAKKAPDENKEFNKLVEYNAEYGIVVLSNGSKEITAKIADIVPKDYLQVAIESSAEYTEMLDVMNTNKDLKTKISKLESDLKGKEELMNANIKIADELKAELDNIKENSDKNFEEFADEKEKYEKLLADKDAKIAELEASLTTETPQPDSPDSDGELATVIAELKEAEDNVKGLEKELAKKDALIDGLNKRLAEASSTKSFVPTDRKPNFDPDAFEAENVGDNDDVIMIHATVEDLNGFTKVKDGTRKKVLVFPVDEEAGDYYNNDEKVIVVGTINGYSIDELLSVKDEKSEE